VRIHFTSNAWDDYQYWQKNDPSTLVRINALIEEVRRNPFKGLGKPEPLKRELSGWWSRRITAEHRLVYRVAGKADDDQRLEIIMCRYHYR
jgi:toxin YoeB